MTRIRPFLATLAVALLLPFAASAQEQPSGRVELELTSVAIGIGTSSGHGVLTLNDGRQFKFSVEGFKIGDLGISRVRAHGPIYRLANLDWFPGTYTAGEAGFVIGGGLSGVLMQNQHGVTISLETAQEGLRLTFAAEAIRIAWE